MNYNNIGSTSIVPTRWVIILTILFAMMVFSLVASAQTVKPSDKVLKDTVIKAINYKLYIGPKGGKYVLKTSKSGVVYKMYISKSK